MTLPPAHPKIYHITHVDNLAAIVADGVILSDAAMIARGGPAQSIGMSGIKQRRLTELGVSPHPETKVGDYVPFYFCPRSVMLYVIHRANHPELHYRGGQGPIVHMEADLRRVIDWADSSSRRWAFSLSNAGAYYTEFRSRIDELDQLDWNAIASTDFRSAEVKERKQAEFLVHDSFPLTMVDRIGVSSSAIQMRAATALARAAQRPTIEIHPEWYF
jgi:hypothetical protein